MTLITDTARAKMIEEIIEKKRKKKAVENKLKGYKAEKDKAARRVKNKISRKARKKK